MDTTSGQLLPLLARADAQESFGSPASWFDGSGLLFERDDLTAPLPGYPGESTPRFASRIDNIAADGSNRAELIGSGRMPALSTLHRVQRAARLHVKGCSGLAQCGSQRKALSFGAPPSLTKQMPDVLLEVPISAPPERVYEAITEQAGLTSWWTPEVSNAEPRVGAVAEFRFGGGYVTKMEVAALESGRRVVWNVRHGAQEWANTRVTWDLAPTERGTTTLRFAHRDYPSTEGSFATVTFNWAWYLASLKTYVEKGQGWPGDPPR